MNRTSAGIATRRYSLVQRLLHWGVAVLVLSALAGAAYHWRIRRDGVMQRMSLFR